MAWSRFAFLAAALMLAGCGYVGDPLPPALNIAGPVTDLRAIQYGDRILINFTIPPLTTEGLVLQHVGRVELKVGDKVVDVPAGATGAIHYDLAVRDWVGRSVVMNVRVVNIKGRPSEWSNAVAMSVVTPVPRPGSVSATPTPEGVQVRWDGAGSVYRVFRRLAEEKQPSLLGESKTPEYLDASAEFGKTYEYLVQALKDRAESEVSAPLAVVNQDKFPPGIPLGLSAVIGTTTIELVWDRRTEPDMKAYRLYRAVEGGGFSLLAEPEAPAYSDRQIESGKKYRYAVSSVDQAGNESERSGIIEATAP